MTIELSHWHFIGCTIILLLTNAFSYWLGYRSCSNSWKKFFDKEVVPRFEAIKLINKMDKENNRFN